MSKSRPEVQDPQPLPKPAKLICGFRKRSNKRKALATKAPVLSPRAHILKNLEDLFDKQIGLPASEVNLYTADRFAKAAYPYPGANVHGDNPLHQGLDNFVKKYT